MQVSLAAALEPRPQSDCGQSERVVVAQKCRNGLVSAESGK